MGIRINRTLGVHPRCDPPPPPSQDGYREGFIKDTFFKNANSGREALKCTLSPKTLVHNGSPLNSVWFRMVTPYVLPFTRATSSHMVGPYTLLPAYKADVE